MNIKQFDIEIEKIEKEAENKKHILSRKFAFDNSTLNVGDFAKDQTGVILIEKIRFGTSFLGEYPECIYYGTNYTKAMKPRADLSKRDVWKSNLRDI